MKKDEFSLLELFQDPLFTMIAIVLMGTVWLIIPGKSTPVDPKAYAAQDTNQSVKREIEVMKEKMKQLTLEIERLREEARVLESRIDRAKDEKEEAKDVGSLAEINEKTREILNKIEKEREKLKLLEDELRRAKEALSRGKGKDEIEIFRTKIDKLEKEIERLKESLKQLEEALKKARRESEKAKEIQDAQKSLVALLQKELKAKLEEIKNMEEDSAKIKDRKTSRITIKAIEETKKEKEFDFQLINNRLFPVDNEHFNVDSGYLKMESGQTVAAVRRTRKPSIKGESILEIQRPDSKFQKALKKLNDKEYRVFFFVHPDSIEIFKKAREIVQNCNFEMTWFPRTNEAIIYSSGLGEGRLGSTDKPRN